MQQEQPMSSHRNVQNQSVWGTGEAILLTGGASGMGNALYDMPAKHGTQVMLAEYAIAQTIQDSGHVALAICDVLSLPEHTVVTEMIELSMRETS